MAATFYSLGRTKTLETLKKLTKPLATASILRFNDSQVQTRCVTNYKKKLITDLDLSKLTDFEKSSDPKEWYYVERCIPLKVVPTPKPFDGSAPSGWTPPREEAKSQPYFIQRTKNHMMPVYLQISYRGMRHITLIKKIEGNIWKLEEDLKAYLESKSTKYYKNIASRINEMTGQIRFRGDHVEHVKQWMISKGF